MKIDFRKYLERDVCHTFDGGNIQLERHFISLRTPANLNAPGTPISESHYICINRYLEAMRAVLITFSAVILAWISGQAQPVVAVYYSGEPQMTETAVEVRADAKKLGTIMPNEVLVEALSEGNRALNFYRTGFGERKVVLPTMNDVVYVEVNVGSLGQRWDAAIVSKNVAPTRLVAYVENFLLEVRNAAMQTSANEGLGTLSRSGKLPVTGSSVACVLQTTDELKSQGNYVLNLFRGYLLELGYTLLEREHIGRVLEEQRFSLEGLTREALSLEGLIDAESLALVELSQFNATQYALTINLIDVASGQIVCTWVGQNTLEGLSRSIFELHESDR